MRRHRSLLRLWQTATFGDFVKILGGVILGISAVFIFFLTPVEHMALRWIWGEDIEFVMEDRRKVFQSQTVRISVVLSPKTSAGVSSGILQLIYKDPTASNQPFRLRSGESTIPIEAFDSAIRTPPFELVAEVIGEHEVTLRLTTEDNEYEATQIVEVLDPGLSPDVAFNNFSGTWMIRLGGHDGEMQLLDRSGKISGQYEIEGPHGRESGTVKGIRDGSVFDVSLLRNETSKWNIEASFAETEADTIEVTGKAQLVIIQGSGWKPSPNQPQLPFIAVGNKIPP